MSRAEISIVIVPEFWSEAKEQYRADGRVRTLRRFGWSDASESDAYRMAQERVAAAVSRAKSGESVRNVDRKIPYNGADGLPIREEIIERHGETVITRNSYGALCLNSPNVLFTDIDIAKDGNAKLIGFWFALFILAGAFWWIVIDTWWPLLVAFVAGLALTSSLARVSARLMSAFTMDPYEAAIARIERFVAENPMWSLRVYRTPMGYRVLAMHATFDPTDEAPFRFMKTLKSDPLYVQMCRNQKCFRARLSPKPWRVGVEHIRPRPGVWPVKEEHLEKRRRWVENYDRKSDAFSSCEYVQTLGKGSRSLDCERVRAIHDQYCKPESGLPIA